MTWRDMDPRSRITNVLVAEAQLFWLLGQTYLLCDLLPWGSDVHSWIELWFLIKVTSAEKPLDVRHYEMLAS